MKSIDFKSYMAQKVKHERILFSLHASRPKLERLRERQPAEEALLIRAMRDNWNNALESGKLQIISEREMVLHYGQTSRQSGTSS